MRDVKVGSRQGQVQWMIRTLCPSVSYKSKAFKMCTWNWHLSVEPRHPVSFASRKSVDVGLFPVLEVGELPPLARFFLRVTVESSNYSTVHKGRLQTRDDFAFPVNLNVGCRPVGFVIDVEFWDLKISPSNGGEDIFIWPIDKRRYKAKRMSGLKCLSRMLNESLLADITINTVDGKQLHAHRAVLSANSPIFHSMFTHDLKEKQSSTIDLDDMASEPCMALLHYMYGTIKKKDLRKHRLALLAAANKYDIPELKDRCEESLLEDIGLGDVFESLQEALLYQLTRLKKACITYLIESGEIYNLEFIRSADSELVEEIFQEMRVHSEALKKAARKGKVLKKAARKGKGETK